MSGGQEWCRAASEEQANRMFVTTYMHGGVHRRRSGATNTARMDGSHEHSDGDIDTPQDGLGNPNMSGISPPQPATLVEPLLQAHDTGFHVITSGTEVGITTVKYIYFSLLFNLF